MSRSRMRTSGRTSRWRGVVVLALLSLTVPACQGEGDPGSPTSLSSVTQRELRVAAAAFFADDTGYKEDVSALLVHVDGTPVAGRYQQAVAEQRQPLAAATTAVVSLVVGIALDRGDLESVEQTLGELLPGHSHAMSADVRGITLRQLLTMTAGFRDDTRQWRTSSSGERGDWVASILRSRRVPTDRVHEAYAGWHLVSAVLREATGRPLLPFAREVLFEPLGITDVVWRQDPRDVTAGSGGLELRPADFAKVGQLMLDDGRWRGAQVVPSSWTREATQPQVTFPQFVEPSGQYGYGWWVLDAHGHPAFAATDRTGQILEVVPHHRLVVVVTTRIGAISRVGVWGPLSWVAQLVVPVLDG